MSSPVTTIRNIGPAMEDAFRRANIGSAEDLRALGADVAYQRLIETGTRPHFIGYYALVMGLQGRPWNDCQGKEKAELRARFDKICAEATPRTGPSSGLTVELDRLGIRL